MDIKLMPEKYKKIGISSELKLSGSGLFNFFNKFAFKDNFFFVLSSVLLISIILISFGLWGYKINLSKDKGILVQEFEELQNQRDLDLENNFIDLKEKIDNFKNIIDKRVYSLNILKVFEELTLPSVQYDDFSADLIKLLVDLKIEANNYNSIAKQVFIFENDSRIESVNFSEVQLERGSLIGSNLKFKLNPSFLHLK